MSKFCKKPVVIEAVQWTGTNVDDVLAFTLGRASVRDESFRRLSSSERVLIIETLEGDMRAGPGDWIIRGVKGEFYPYKSDIFAATYEPDTALRACAEAPAPKEGEAMELPDVEVVAAKVHEAWMETKRAQGITSRPAADGTEQMVPYADLPDALQELDRSTVRAVYAAIEASAK